MSSNQEEKEKERKKKEERYANSLPFPNQAKKVDPSRFKPPPSQELNSLKVQGGIQPPPPKSATKGEIKTDWHQTDSQAIVTLYIKGVKENDISFEPEQFAFKITIQNDPGLKSLLGSDTFSLSYRLEKEIHPQDCKVNVGSSKVEIILKKKDEGVKWTNLGEKETTFGSSNDSNEFETSNSGLIQYLPFPFLFSFPFPFPFFPFEIQKKKEKKKPFFPFSFSVPFFLFFIL